MIKSVQNHLTPEGKPTSAGDFLARKLTLSALNRAAAGCKGCSLYQHATQTVFGEVPARALLMLVGDRRMRQELAGDLSIKARYATCTYLKIAS
jgi:hypothetical protein